MSLFNETRSCSGMTIPKGTEEEGGPSSVEAQREPAELENLSDEEKISLALFQVFAVSQANGGLGRTGYVDRKFIARPNAKNADKVLRFRGCLGEGFEELWRMFRNSGAFRIPKNDVLK